MNRIISYCVDLYTMDDGNVQVLVYIQCCLCGYDFNDCVFVCSCFLKHPGVFFGAFLAPILVILLFNVVIFIWVIVILLKHTQGNIKRSSEKSFNFPPTTRGHLWCHVAVQAHLALCWTHNRYINGSNIVRTVL